MFFKNSVINIIDKNWLTIKKNVKFKHIPRVDELILIDKTYYKVITIIHDTDNDNNIFIVVEIKNN